jgi:hypothetical protein
MSRIRISAFMIKPNHLPLSQHALRRAGTLSRAASIETDIMLLPLLRYQQLIEQVRMTYRPRKDETCELPLVAGHLLSELEMWKSELPAALQESGMSL